MVKVRVFCLRMSSAFISTEFIEKVAQVRSLSRKPRLLSSTKLVKKVAKARSRYLY
ncbi:hypothetical protein [Aliterella atlantica]|uniref:hypothetical protein n=1 Tax=Aliterella atlantica TaxID=1827278 RepID=UPI001364B0CA|nr:hypothetical protein [Aliterella atlantica]